MPSNLSVQEVSNCMWILYLLAGPAIVDSEKKA